MAITDDEGMWLIRMKYDIWSTHSEQKALWHEMQPMLAVPLTDVPLDDNDSDLALVSVAIDQGLLQTPADAGATCDRCGPAVAAAVHLYGVDLCRHCVRKYSP